MKHSEILFTTSLRVSTVFTETVLSQAFTSLFIISMSHLVRFVSDAVCKSSNIVLVLQMHALQIIL